MNATFSHQIDTTDILGAAAVLSMDLSPSEQQTFHTLGAALAEAMASVDALPQMGPTRIDATRAHHHHNVPGDPFNAVVRWCAVKGSGGGGPLDQDREPIAYGRVGIVRTSSFTRLVDCCLAGRYSSARWGPRTDDVSRREYACDESILAPWRLVGSCDILVK